MNKVYVELNVLRSLVMNQIRRHVNGRDILVEDHHGFLDVSPEFTKELVKPLSSHVHHRMVLGLGTRP